MRQVIDSIPQMSYTVRDLDRAIALFTEGLGVGPFLNVKFGHVEGDASFDDGAMPIEDYYLNGDYVGTYGIRMGAVTWDNGIQLELIEPMENRSLFRQYLDSHGPGPQHIAVSSPLTFQETLGAMAAAGNSPGLDGKGGPGGGLCFCPPQAPWDGSGGPVPSAGLQTAGGGAPSRVS